MAINDIYKLHITHAKTCLMLTPALLKVSFLLSLNRPDCTLLANTSGVFMQCLVGIKGKERPQHAETTEQKSGNPAV